MNTNQNSGSLPDAKILETIIQGPPASAPVTVEFYEEDLNILDAAVGGLTDLLENEEIAVQVLEIL